HDEDQDHDESVVGRDRVHVVHLAERRRIRVAHAPRKPRTRDRMVLAVDDVADAADRLAEGYADHRDVEHESERKPQASRRKKARDRRADGRAGRPDAAVPEGEHVERTGRVDVPVVEDVRDASAQETADDHGDRERVDPVVADEVARGAERHEAADDHPDQREDRVPGEADGSDVKVRIEWEVDQTAEIDVRARVSIARRNSTVTAAAKTRSAMVWSWRRPKA